MATTSISISKARIERTLWMTADLVDSFISAMARFSSQERIRLSGPMSAELVERQPRSGVNVIVNYTEVDGYRFLEFLEEFSKSHQCDISWPS